MKRFLYIFLYLNIYSCAISLLNAQQLELRVTAEIPIRESLKDSLGLKETFEDLKSLRNEADSLEQRLQRLGFVDSELKSLAPENDTVFLADYYIGPLYRTTKIYIQPGEFSKRELSGIASEVSDEFILIPFSDTERALIRLNQVQSSDGNAFGKLRLTDIRKKNDTIIAILERTDGAVRRVDSIAIRGYDKFPRSFIRYYAGIKTGMDFDKDYLTRQAGIINSLGFVANTKAPEVLFREKETTIYLYLEKRNNNLFDGILGFATDEETGNLQLNGYLNLELNNNLNYGEQLLINYKADGNEQQNFRARVRLPYLFRSPLGIEAELKIFKRDSTFVTTDQSVKLNYQVNPTASVYIGYKANESSNLLDEQVVGSTVEDYKGSFLLAGMVYSRNQDDLLWPRKTVITIDSEIGERDDNSTAQSQTRLAFDAFHIIDLNYNNAVFLRNTTGALFSDDYLTNELFRFGGITSIRGFNENSIDASLYSVLNTEYRYRFNQGFYLHSIIDLGYFENEIFDQKERLYSFGIGLGLLTKAGVLNFSFANGISEDQNFEFSNTKIHLSLSSRF